VIIEASGLIYDASGQPAHRRIAFFTSLCRLKSGEILAGFQVGSGKHSVDSTLGFCRSSDGGNTWRPIPTELETTLDGVAGSLSAPTVLEVEPGRLRLFATWFDRSEPSRPLFDPATEGILHSRLLTAESTDCGASWSRWHVLPTPELSGCSLTGPALAWPDGTLGLPFESFKEFDDPRPARHGSWIMLSRDAGRTFGPPLLLAPQHEMYYWDARLCTGAGPGEYVAMYWTHDRGAERDLNVHLRRAAIAENEVRGKAIAETPIRGQICAPLVLDETRVLAFVVDRHRPGTMKLWLSGDGGLTWPAEESLIVLFH
jgi:hypothetical protein